MNVSPETTKVLYVLFGIALLAAAYFLNEIQMKLTARKNNKRKTAK